jgi:antirestriction protein ArdC
MREELIAEFTALFLGKQFELWPHPGHLDYIDTYAGKRNQEAKLADAKREAQRAVDYLNQLAGRGAPHGR